VAEGNEVHTGLLPFADSAPVTGGTPQPWRSN